MMSRIDIIGIVTEVLLELSLQRRDFGLLRLLELLLLLQVSEHLAAHHLQALHLPLALVELPLQGLHTQRQLWTERESQGVRGEQSRSWVVYMGGAVKATEKRKEKAEAAER